MDANEEYVRSVWGASFERVFEDHRVRLCCGYPDCDGDLPGEPHEACCPAYIADENYWSAARAYTEGVLEQVRQLREEMEELPVGAAIDKHVMHYWSLGGEDGQPFPPDEISRQVVRRIRRLRTLARLEAEITRLTAGMKPEKAGSK